MTAVTKNAAVASNVVKKANETARTFVGKAWINTVKQGDFVGTQFINLTLDRDVHSVVLQQGIKVQLWPNKKREGKNDADYRVSILEPVAATA